MQTASCRVPEAPPQKIFIHPDPLYLRKCTQVQSKPSPLMPTTRTTFFKSVFSKMCTIQITNCRPKALPETIQLCYNQHLHRKTLQTFVLRKRNARSTEPACGRSGRKGLLGPQALRNLTFLPFSHWPNRGFRRCAARQWLIRRRKTCALCLRE